MNSANMKVTIPGRSLVVFLALLIVPAFGAQSNKNNAPKPEAQPAARPVPQPQANQPQSGRQPQPQAGKQPEPQTGKQPQHPQPNVVPLKTGGTATLGPGGRVRTIDTKNGVHIERLTWRVNDRE